MERIQSALAKARAAREGKATPGGKPTVQAAAQAQAWAEIAELPLDAGLLTRNRIIAHASVPEAATFDVMRTNLLRQMRSNGWTRVAVTSPTAGCGKTTVLLNLAFSLARLADVKVLVIELDLRRPSIGRVLGGKGGLDFASVLSGARPPASQLRRWGPNLAFGCTSSPLASPAELLSAPRTADIIDALEERLRPDIILFDTTPMLVSDDTIAFLDQVDCALMIAAAEETTASDIEHCGKELAKYTQVLGVVLNRCRFNDATQDYGMSYS